MPLRPLLLMLFVSLTVSLTGCGGADDVPEDAPVTPEAGDPEYEQYNNMGRYGPDSEKGK